MQKCWSTQNGSIVISALIAAFVLTLISSVIFGYFFDLKMQQNRVGLIQTVSQIKLNVTEAVNSDSAWYYTTLPGNNSTPTMTATPFKLYDATGAVIYDSTNLNNGYSQGGTICAWSPTGSPACPLRLDLRWQSIAVCNGSSPAFQITGAFVYAPGIAAVKPPVNWLNYSFSFCRSAGTQTFSCTGLPPGGSACVSPDGWFCSSIGWVCGRIYQ